MTMPRTCILSLKIDKFLVLPSPVKSSNFFDVLGVKSWSREF